MFPRSRGRGWPGAVAVIPGSPGTAACLPPASREPTGWDAAELPTRPGDSRPSARIEPANTDQSRPWPITEPGCSRASSLSRVGRYDFDNMMDSLKKVEYGCGQRYSSLGSFPVHPSDPQIINEPGIVARAGQLPGARVRNCPTPLV